MATNPSGKRTGSHPIAGPPVPGLGVPVILEQKASILCNSDFVNTLVTIFNPKPQPENEKTSRGRKLLPREKFNVNWLKN
jgi:hypothetical protein